MKAGLLNKSWPDVLCWAFWPYSLFFGQEEMLFKHSMDTYGKVTLMVLVSGLLAMYIYYQGLRKISARACTLAEMFFPFMAVIVNCFS
jgi:drug/metabolite transporter (DMT)-like permease